MATCRSLCTLVAACHIVRCAIRYDYRDRLCWASVVAVASAASRVEAHDVSEGVVRGNGLSEVDIKIAAGVDAMAIVVLGVAAVDVNVNVGAAGGPSRVARTVARMYPPLAHETYFCAGAMSNQGGNENQNQEVLPSTVVAQSTKFRLQLQNLLW